MKPHNKPIAQILYQQILHIMPLAQVKLQYSLLRPKTLAPMKNVKKIKYIETLLTLEQSVLQRRVELLKVKWLKSISVLQILGGKIKSQKQLKQLQKQFDEKIFDTVKAQVQVVKKAESVPTPAVKITTPTTITPRNHSHLSVKSYNWIWRKYFQQDEISYLTKMLAREKFIKYSYFIKDCLQRNEAVNHNGNRNKHYHSDYGIVKGNEGDAVRKGKGEGQATSGAKVKHTEATKTSSSQSISQPHLSLNLYFSTPIINKIFRTNEQTIIPSYRRKHLFQQDKHTIFNKYRELAEKIQEVIRNKQMKDFLNQQFWRQKKPKKQKEQNKIGKGDQGGYTRQNNPQSTTNPYLLHNIILSHSLYSNSSEYLTPLKKQFIQMHKQLNVAYPYIGKFIIPYLNRIPYYLKQPLHTLNIHFNGFVQFRELFWKRQLFVQLFIKHAEEDIEYNMEIFFQAMTHEFGISNDLKSQSMQRKAERTAEINRGGGWRRNNKSNDTGQNNGQNEQGLNSRFLQNFTSLSSLTSSPSLIRMTQPNKNYQQFYKNSFKSCHTHHLTKMFKLFNKSGRSPNLLKVNDQNNKSAQSQSFQLFFQCFDNQTLSFKQQIRKHLQKSNRLSSYYSLQAFINNKYQKSKDHIARANNKSFNHIDNNQQINNNDGQDNNDANIKDGDVEQQQDTNKSSFTTSSAAIFQSHYTPYSNTTIFQKLKMIILRLTMCNTIISDRITGGETNIRNSLQSEKEGQERGQATSLRFSLTSSTTTTKSTSVTLQQLKQQLSLMQQLLINFYECQSMLLLIILLNTSRTRSPNGASEDKRISTINYFEDLVSSQQQQRHKGNENGVSLFRQQDESIICGNQQSQLSSRSQSQDYLQSAVVDEQIDSSSIINNNNSESHSYSNYDDDNDDQQQQLGLQEMFLLCKCVKEYKKINQRCWSGDKVNNQNKYQQHQNIKEYLLRLKTQQQSLIRQKVQLEARTSSNTVEMPSVVEFQKEQFGITATVVPTAINTSKTKTTDRNDTIGIQQQKQSKQGKNCHELTDDNKASDKTIVTTSHNPPKILSTMIKQICAKLYYFLLKQNHQQRKTPSPTSSDSDKKQNDVDMVLQLLLQFSKMFYQSDFVNYSPNGSANGSVNGMCTGEMNKKVKGKEEILQMTQQQQNIFKLLPDQLLYQILNYLEFQQSKQEHLHRSFSNKMTMNQKTTNQTNKTIKTNKTNKQKFYQYLLKQNQQQPTNYADFIASTSSTIMIAQELYIFLKEIIEMRKDRLKWVHKKMGSNDQRDCQQSVLSSEDSYRMSKQQVKKQRLKGINIEFYQRYFLKQKKHGLGFAEKYDCSGNKEIQQNQDSKEKEQTLQKNTTMTVRNRASFIEGELMSYFS